MTGFWSLYKKEFKLQLFFLEVVSLLIIGWELFLIYKLRTWPDPLAGLGFLPFSIFPLLMLWQGYQSYRQEWKDDTIYFLLSLPRRGWLINLAKFSAGMTQFLIFTFLTGGIIFFAHQGRINNLLGSVPQGVDISMFYDVAIKMLVLYLVSGAVIYIMSQFACLIGRFYERFNGLVSIVVFVLSFYLIHRVGGLIAPLLRWLPDFPIEVYSQNAEFVNQHLVYVGSGPIIGSLLVIVGLFFLGGWVLENHLEV